MRSERLRKSDPSFPFCLSTMSDNISDAMSGHVGTDQESRLSPDNSHVNWVSLGQAHDGEEEEEDSYKKCLTQHAIHTLRRVDVTVVIMRRLSVEILVSLFDPR